MKKFNKKKKGKRKDPSLVVQVEQLLRHAEELEAVQRIDIIRSSRGKHKKKQNYCYERTQSFHIAPDSKLEFFLDIQPISILSS